MQHSDAKPTSNGFDCSGATDAEKRLERIRDYVECSLRNLTEFSEPIDDDDDSTEAEAVAFCHTILRIAGSARADDANDSGVQETEPHWIWGRASLDGNDAPVCSKCGWCINPAATGEHRIECWQNNTDKGLDARRSEVS